VVDPAIAENLDEPGVGIHFDDAGDGLVRPGGICAETAVHLRLVVHVWVAEIPRHLESWLDLPRVFVGVLVNEVHDFSEWDGADRGAARKEAAVTDLDIYDRDLEMFGSDLAHLLSDLGRSQVNGGSPDDQAPRAVVPEAERACLGVSLNDPDVRYVDAERVGGDLRHRGLVSGSRGSDSRQDGHRAGRAHPDRCRIVARDERRARYGAASRHEFLADADPETAALV